MNNLRWVYMWPVWLVGVFTMEKTFKKNPIIGNRLLNKLGLHTARIQVADWLFRFHLWLLSPLVGREDYRSFTENGFILKEDFLPQAMFEALENELRSYSGHMREEVEGSTLTHRLYFSDELAARMPAVRTVMEYKPLQRLMRFASGRNRLPVYHVENLMLLEGPDRPDQQMSMHRDTFHPCTRGWLYMDDVEPDLSPFKYFAGSHKLNGERRKWEYEQSIKSCDLSWKRNWDGAFRVSDEDLQNMTLPEITAMTVKKNTLLIGNVFGFHQRGASERAGERMTFWMQSRYNPFSPLVTLLPALRFRIDQWIMGQYYAATEGKGRFRKYHGPLSRGRQTDGSP